LERAKRIELSTSTLARWRSTAELRPLINPEAVGAFQGSHPLKMSAGEGRLIDGSLKSLQGPKSRFL
jgi:hypothetical protein